MSILLAPASPASGPLVVVRSEGPLRVRADLGATTSCAYGGASIAGDVAGDPAARAALLARPGAVLCLAGAAWALAGRAGGMHPPDPEHAPRPGRRRDDLPRQLGLARNDVLDLGGTLVTTPRRTATDCARLLPPEEARVHLRALAASGLDLVAVARSVATRSTRGGWGRVYDALLDVAADVASGVAVDALADGAVSDAEVRRPAGPCGRRP